MQTEEQNLIDGLFSRLKQAETQSGSRDAQAEQLILQRLREQPSAPYYMAQVILIQEAALKRLEQRVQTLESQITSLQQNSTPGTASSGGFLSGLFGGSSPARNTAPAPASRGGWNEPGPRLGQGHAQPQAGAGNWGSPGPAAAPSRAGGFLAGAMQTAAGVAGGMLLADTLSGLFHHDSPAEIAQTLNEPAPAAASPVADAGGWNDSSDPGYAPDDSFLQAGTGSTDSSFFDDGGFYDENDDDDDSFA